MLRDGQRIDGNRGHGGVQLALRAVRRRGDAGHDIVIVSTRGQTEGRRRPSRDIASACAAHDGTWGRRRPTGYGALQVIAYEHCNRLLACARFFTIAAFCPRRGARFAYRPHSLVLREVDLRVNELPFEHQDAGLRVAS
jgi:hypothetical protein